MIAAMSAPPDLAIRQAEAAGITLIAFARDERMNIYSGHERLVSAASCFCGSGGSRDAESVSDKNSHPEQERTCLVIFPGVPRRKRGSPFPAASPFWLTDSLLKHRGLRRYHRNKSLLPNRQHLAGAPNRVPAYP